MLNVFVELTRQKHFHAQHVARSLHSNQTKMSLNSEAATSLRICCKLWKFNVKQKRMIHVQIAKILPLVTVLHAKCSCVRNVLNRIIFGQATKIII